jgi:hypothetical protein
MPRPALITNKSKTYRKRAETIRNRVRIRSGPRSRRAKIRLRFARAPPIFEATPVVSEDFPAEVSCSYALVATGRLCGLGFSLLHHKRGPQRVHNGASRGSKAVTGHAPFRTLPEGRVKQPGRLKAAVSND